MQYKKNFVVGTECDPLQGGEQQPRKKILILSEEFPGNIFHFHVRNSREFFLLDF